MKYFMFFLFLLSCSGLNAKKLTVLYDTGESTVFNKTSDPDIRLERPDPIKVLHSQFPIKSNKWRLSNFESKQISFPEMKSDIFLIGCDDVSLEWVMQRKEYLMEGGALGFVISCSSYDEYTSLKASIYPIVVQPANMDKVGDHLNHYQYPAYIHKKAIEQ